MKTQNSDNFYTDLPALTSDITLILEKKELFTPLPPDWDILITDIAGSTQASQNGKYREVNLIAASTIVAALNIAKSHKIEIPFIFGGDGATLACPAWLTEEICTHIQAIQKNAQKNFGLNLRIGSVGVQKLYQEKHEILIAKSMITRGYNQALFLGDGLSVAETLVKTNSSFLFFKDIPLLEANLEGLECRWKEIPHRSNHEEVVCLLIAPRPNAPQVYAEVLRTLQSIYGNSHERHPITEEQLTLMKSFQELQKEIQIKYLNPSKFQIFRRVLQVLYASFLFKYNLTLGAFNARLYKKQIVAATDTLKIDGSIKTIVAGTKEQRRKFIAYLQSLEDEKKILFGHFVTDSTVMTCYVSDRSTGHIHFVDGKNGGYTEAAIEFKAKLKKV